MIVNKVSVGDLQSNCYVIKDNNNCLIIDPGDEIDKIANLVGNLKVLGILITHYHFDHIGALKDVKKLYDCEIIDYKSNDDIKIGAFNIKKIPTKGHTTDSVTFYFYNDNIMFTGDFLFKKSIGRCDLPTGNYNEMKTSINVIKSYDKNIIIYPGHGDKTTLKYELNNNLYLKGENNE